MKSEINARKKLKVGVVGLGTVGRKHVETYFNHNQCELSWIYDNDENLNRKISNEFEGIPIAKSYRTMVNDKSIDIISICTYDDQHYDQIILAFKNGKHIFVEKPMCSTLDELRKIKNAWEKAKRPTFDSNLMSRGSPLYKWLKTFIERGGIGRIYAIDAEYWYGRLHKLIDGWRNSVENYSVMAGGAIHLIDTMFMMIDERPSKCYALGNKICTENTTFKYNDFATSTYSFNSSIIARVTANFGCVHPHQHVLRIFGDRATFILDDAGPRIHATRDNISQGVRDKYSAVIPIDLEYRPTHKGDLIIPFINNITQGIDSSSITQQNFDVMSVILAAENSIKLKKEVVVDYV